MGKPMCDDGARVALAAVSESNLTPTQVWINSGLFCGELSLLFDPLSNCPHPASPNGEQWVGNAEIAFAETDEHAGINLAFVADKLEGTLIGYRTPALEWCSGECPTVATTDGPFRLELVLPHLDWKAGDPISGTAILSFARAQLTTIHGASASLIVFSYDEVGGIRRVHPVRTADCAPYLLDPATPFNQELSKSGAIGGEEPYVDFLRTFFAASGVRLPSGVWNITADAGFVTGTSCLGEDSKDHELIVTTRITVRD